MAEMEQIVSYVGTMKTDDDVNALSATQLEESQVKDKLIYIFLIFFYCYSVNYPRK